MGENNEIIQMFRDLEADNVWSTNDFYRDIISLLDSGEVQRKFIEVFSKDMKISNINAYNKFELLNKNLTEHQRRILDGNSLYRYEFRRNKKNIKCIFILEKEDGEKILLSAFKEDWSKEKGNDSYKTNIPRAIKIYNDLPKKNKEVV